MRTRKSPRMMQKTRNRRLQRFLPRAAAALLLVAGAASGAAPDDAMRLLQRADSIKSTHHAEFVGILNSLTARTARLSVAQKEYLSYLTAWNAVIDGDNETATGMLKRLILQAHDVTLQFRARSTLMNQEELTRNYDAAYLELDRLVQLLPRVADKDAREQALLNASQLYRAVGQTDLSLRYAQMLMDENWAGRGLCRGGQQKVSALFESGRLQSVDAEVRAITAACVEKADLLYANDINMHVARLYISQNKLDEAITLLKDHYDEVVRSQYPRMLAEYDALLADAYRRKGFAALAEKFASDSVTHGGQGHYPATMARALGVLYDLAKNQGDFKLALAFHEQYTQADKGSLDEVSARQLAYEKVVHENIADKLQVAAASEGAGRKGGGKQPPVHCAADHRPRVHRAVGLPGQALAVAFHECGATRWPDRYQQPAVFHRRRRRCARVRQSYRAGAVHRSVRPGSFQIHQRPAWARDGRLCVAADGGEVPAAPEPRGSVRALRR